LQSDPSRKQDAFKERLKSDNRTSGISKRAKDISIQGDASKSSGEPAVSAVSRNQLEGVVGLVSRREVRGAVVQVVQLGCGAWCVVQM
jgi:hypothetical protein